MTARRKDDETLEEIGWSRGTKAYRWVLLGAVLAATPIGQNILNGVGIKTPVASELTALSTELAGVKKDVAALKEDVAHVKDDVKAVKTQSDKLEVTFTGFQVDFAKFQKEPK